MSIIKNALTGLAIATMAFTSNVALTSAAELSEKVNVNNNADTSKHFDPVHIGHSHKCNNCQRTYNQQGDNGLYSQGSNICPYCGFANSMPAPTPYNPPVPVPPMPYNPPSPVYYGENVDELLNAYDHMPSMSAGDRMLAAGAARVNSIKGLCRLAIKVFNDDSFNAIISNFNRPNIAVDVNPEDLKYFSDKASRFDKSDAIVLGAAKRFISIQYMLSSASNLYRKNSAEELLNHADLMYGRLIDPPSVSDMKRYNKNAFNFEIADRILLTGARYMTSVAELAELLNMAVYDSTKRAIEMMYQSVGQAPYYPPYQQGPYYRSLETRNTKAAGLSFSNKAENKQLSDDVISAINKAKSELKVNNSEIELTKEDINNLNIEKINVFVSKFSENKFKNTGLLKMTRELLVKRLKSARITNPELNNMLEKIK